MLIKRVLAIFVLCMLLVVQVSASADQPEKILFRGLEWGSNVDTVKTGLIDSGVIATYTVSEFSDEKWDSPNGVRPEWDYRPVPIMSLECEAVNDEPVCKVAGYNVIKIEAKFLAGINNESNTISYDYNDADFVYAQYVILERQQDNNETLNEAMTNLTNKLCSLYGDYIEAESIGLVKDTYCWIAKDESVVALETATILGHWVINITYEYNAKEHAEKLFELSTLSDVGNADGLSKEHAEQLDESSTISDVDGL